jgi:serine/threonine protein kinase
MIARIGKYEIRDELGKGGFGQVYLGLDPTIDRLVAIKVLSAGGDSSQLIRFQTEATAAGNLKHKNIVTIYEFGEDRGMFFLAMEYLAGQDLQKIIDAAGAHSVLDKMRIMTQIAEGLGFAHQDGVVHRDIKPANIMLLPDGNVKIMDFGIARLTRDNSARLTQAGYLIGSVSHMAPEQFNGVEADVLCDIWAYGTIYYELLTGQNPFHAVDAISTMNRVVNVNQDSAKALCPECPEALSRVIDILLEKDRGKRYQSLEDVLFETTPILLDLQKAELSRSVSQARALIAGGKIDEAHQIVRSVLALEPMHAEGRALREQLQNEVKLRTTRGRVEALRQRAEKAIIEGNYGEGIQALGSALQISPADTALRLRLSELQKAQEQREKAERLLTQARSELESQKLTSAFQSASEALNAEPDNSTAKDLVARIESMIAERDSQRRLKEGLTKVRGLLVVEALDEALEVLEELAKHAPEHPQVRELLARTHRQREARDRRLRINAGIQKARDSIRSEDFAGAITTLEALAGEFPDETSVAEMLAYAQDEFQAKERAARIKALGNQAWAALKAKDFDRALGLVGEGLASYPGNERLARLQDVILAGRAEQQRIETIKRALDESAQLQSVNRFDDALAVLDSALRECPAQAELQSAREEVRRKIEERERQRRAEAIQEALAKARGMVEGGKAESATRLLANATAHYPNEPELASLLDWAREQQKRQHEKQGVDEILSRAVALEQDGKLAQALDAVEDGLLRYPSATELADAAARLRTLVRLNQDLEAIRQPIARKDWATALSLLAGAMERHPDEESLSRMAEQARQEQQKAALEAVGVKARRELDAHDIDRARETVEEGLRTFGPHPKLTALKNEAGLALERRENLELARKFSRNRDWSSAEAVLRKVLDRDSSDKEARALWDGVSKEHTKEQRWQLREEGREKALRSLREQRFEDAEARLHSLLKEFPEDSALVEDLRRAEEATRQHALQETLLKGRQLAAALLKAQQFDSAISELRKLLLQFPQDPGVEEDLMAAQAAKQDYERRETCERERRKAAALLTKRQFDPAIRCLEALSERFPEDLAIKEDLASAAGAKALFEERHLLDQRVQELEKLYRKGDAQGIKEQVSRDGGMQDARIRELADWADSEIARHAQEVARESTEILRQRRRRKIFVSIGIGTAAVVSFLVIWFLQSPGKPSALTLSPAEIVFNIQGGATAIASQTILLKSGSRPEPWSSSASENWLSASPQGGTTPASVIVSVNPALLNPGFHSGKLIFAGPNIGSKSDLKVSVTVERRAEPPKSAVEITQAAPPPKPETSGIRTPPPTNIKARTSQNPVGQQTTAPVVVPTPTPVIEQPKPLPEIVDCHVPSYHGLREGNLRWINGSLDPNGVLVLPAETLAGGRVTGNSLPGCDVNISLDSSEVEVLENPSPENRFRRIKLRNKSAAPISSIVIRWRVK